jgi:hypothetical protein
MVANGLPDNLATELEAIEAVMGPLDKLEKARGASRHVEHDEQGGSGGDRRKGGSARPSWTSWHLVTRSTTRPRSRAAGTRTGKKSKRKSNSLLLNAVSRWAYAIEPVVRTIFGGPDPNSLGLEPWKS